MRIVCASANPDKVAEIAALLEGAVELAPRPDDVPDVVEDAATLEGNARLKAVAICDATGEPAVADDTGLFVDALGGAPGVWTARFAGEGATYAENCAKLLSSLDAVADRSASFRTVVLVRWPSGSELVVEGVCPGRIATVAAAGSGLRLRPAVHPRRGRRASVQRDDRRGEERHLTPGPSVRRPARRVAWLTA